MSKIASPSIWFLCGSQHLYGEGPLRQVEENARAVVDGLAQTSRLPLPLAYKALLTTPDEIARVCRDANGDPDCAGVIVWMHTFSPAKMWIRGLTSLAKPLLHLHTQFHRDLPWGTIDMDFMNLNQAAHGDREAGFLHTRLRLARKVVVGHWSDSEVHDRLAAWMRAARAWLDWQGARIIRFGDNMRQVAVTEGDKVGAEMQFGFSTNTHGVGDLAKRVAAVTDRTITALCADYEKIYTVAPALKKGGDRHEALRYSARLELGLRGLLEDLGAAGFTDTFEDLHGLRQLPGMATQRLMADGYGFGGEGDWKTSALVRAMKVMADGLPGGASFMEDYTYHLSPRGHQVLGAHMLEICPSIASGKPRVEIHPLGIGGKEDPVRLVFDARPGEALNASLVDLGNRFRLVFNEVTAVRVPRMPRLPVARAVWECRPDFKTACQSWILAGGAHHTGFSYAVTAEMLEDFATMAGIEMVRIGEGSTIARLEQDLRTNEVYYHLAGGFRH